VLNSIDQNSVIFLNSFIEDNDLRTRLLGQLGDNAILRGFPIIFPLVTLWFYSDDRERRARIFAGIFATFVAVGFSVFMQRHVYVHTRPFLDETLHLKLLYPELNTQWDRLSSFPSDTATLYFALSVVIFLEWPLMGAAAFLWSFLTVGVIRVVTGYHYPSDILGALILGPGCVLLIAQNRLAKGSFDRLIKHYQSREYIVHAIFFIAVAEAYNVFVGLQPITKILSMIWKRLAHE
jgi:membrane-associated phospholipid phosphatase